MTDLERLRRHVTDTALALQLAQAYVTELQQDWESFPLARIQERDFYFRQAQHFEADRLLQYQKALEALREYERNHPTEPSTKSAEYLT